MYKLDTALSSHILGDKLFITKDREIVVSPIPTVPIYEEEDGGKEMFFTSKTDSWREAVEVPCTHQHWLESVDYPFPFMTHMFISRPELMINNKMSNELKVMYFDIETQSDGSGRFPRAENDPMIMFGYAINDGEIMIHYVKDLKNRPAGIEDRELLREFMEVIAKEDPDVIVTYNGWNFDLPYINTRARKLGISMEPLLRCNNLSDQDRETLMETHFPTGKLTGNMGGRVHYDIFHVDVMRDQKLSGIKDRKMKTVGKWFLRDITDEIIDLEDGISNTRAMMLSEEGLQKMIKYLESDIRVTRGLANVYLPINIMAANEMQVPLNLIVNRSNGTMASIHVLKHIMKANIIPDKSNKDLFPELYALIEHNKELDSDVKKNFQGAYVDLFKRGTFKKLWKLDFGSLYPSIIILFNLSYETIQFELKDMMVLHGDRETHWKNFTYERLEHDLKLNIPDSNYRRILPIIVDQSHRGILPKVLMDGLAARKAIRETMKTLDKASPEYLALDSRQNVQKVINNSIFGVMSNPHSMGYLPIGFTITGLGRVLIRKTIEMISDPKLMLCETSGRVTGEPWSEEWRRTSPIVEIDTDGLILEGEPDVDRVNTLMTDLIKSEFGIDNKVLKMEKEEFGMGYIHAMKNYLMLEPGKKDPIVHGNFFKSSKAAPVVDRVVKLLIDNLLYAKISSEDAVSQARDIDKVPADDFKIKIRMSKNLKDYTSKGTKMIINMEDDDFIIQETNVNNKVNQIQKIAEMYKEAYGFVPLKGDTLEFVVAKEIVTGKRVQIPFNKMLKSSMYVIDKSYYLEAIDTLLEPITYSMKKESVMQDIWEL